jgi:multiple sugar transport system substrate-binding protein
MKLVTRTGRPSGLAIAAAVAVAAALALTGCTPSEGSSPSGKRFEGQSLTYWATIQGSGAASTKKTLDAEFDQFTKLTGAKVSVEVIPWTTLQTRVLNAVTSNTGADVMEIGNTQAPSLAASGGFVKFTPSEFKKIGGKSKFVKTSLAETGLEGKPPISVPVYAGVYALAYNKADFAAAGISGPPTSWSELKADGRKLTAQGKYGLAIDGSDTTDAAHWAFMLGEQAGNPLYDSSGKPAFATMKMARALQNYIGLFASDGIVNPASAQKGTQPLSDFANGHAAMTIGQGVATSLTHLGMKSSEFGISGYPLISPLPAGGKAIESHIAGINLAVRASTSHMAASLALVKFLTSPAAQSTINQAYGSLPVVQSAYKLPAFQDPTTQTYLKILADHAAAMPKIPSEAQMEPLLGGAITTLIAQTASSGKSPSDSEVLAALQAAQKQLIASTGGSN